MNNIQIVAHTSFLGQTGYADHSKNFFTNLNNYLPVRIRNYSHTAKFSQLEKDNLHLLIQQKLDGHPLPVGRPFTPDPNDLQVNIILNESHHYFFYDEYPHPFIFYNVWESTRQLPEFFNRMLCADQFWCPTEFQRKNTIDQGYPEDRVKVVPEGVNGNLFHPASNRAEKKALFAKYNLPENSFVFMIFGRWDFRKSTQEMIQAWYNQFGKQENCYLILSADNPFSNDGMKTTEERLKHFKLEHNHIKVLHFPPQDEYIKWLQYGSCLLQCSRSEGWGIPLMEALACGTPSICSDWGGHLEFADGIAYKVSVPQELPPKNVYMLGDNHDLGVWGEPDFDHFQFVMKEVYKNYDNCKLQTMQLSKYIRQLYTWDNAVRKAEGFVKELITNKYHYIENKQSACKLETTPNVQTKKKLVKINLGCGNDIRAGYINVDKYNNTKNVDYNWDLGKLEVEDESIDEIYTSHVFEHIQINDVYSVLEEWERVLCPGGKIVMRLPNLETEVKIWLDSPDDKKWLEVHRIFGSQSHEGNTHFNGHNPESLKYLIERFNFKVTSLDTGNRGYGDEIQLTAEKIKPTSLSKPNYITHFVNGPFAEVKGDPNDKGFYVFDFLDPDNNSSVHQQMMGINTWTRPHRKYFTNWLTRISRNGKVVYEHKLDLKGKNVLISIDTKCMGDTIAFFPYVKEFKEKHQCHIWVSTFWNEFFETAKEYKELQFITPGSVVKNLYASYSVGCRDNDFNHNKTNWRSIPLQQVASDYLGLEYKEIVPSIGMPIGERPIKEKYVTISEFSTFQGKFWNNPGGWQIVVDYLVGELGYKVAVISKEESKLKNVIDLTNSPIEETVRHIGHADFHIGVSTGPVWLAWALKVPTILISGFTATSGEYSTNIQRVINEDVCHGCFNNPNISLDRGDWNWCPFHKDTPRQFECSKSITPKMVIDAVSNILSTKSV